MQTTSNATLFQTSYSEALGAYRSRKAIATSGLVTSTTTASSSARYGYPIHLHPNFEQAVITNAADLAVEGSGADGGRYRVLSLRVDAGWVWTSEAGGIVRQVCPETGRTVAVYKGAKAPVPSFDFITGKEGEKLLVTGSWDRAIRVYRISTPDQKVASVTPVTEVAAAMTDFIKCIHVFVSDGRTYIATAGSDKSVMIWDATSLLSSAEGSLKCVYQSKNHTRPINALASLTGLDGTTRVYSADSMGRILESTLNPSSLRLEVQREVQGFSTSVYDLNVGWRREEVEGDPPASAADAFVSEVKEDTDGSRFRLVAELWGASGDKSAAGYRLSPSLQPASSLQAGTRSTSTQPPLGRDAPLTTPYIKIHHDDFVKTVLPLSLHLPPHSTFEQYSIAVVTGGSDEHLRLFPHLSRSTTLTAARDEAEVYEVEAHWHEVTSLAVWVRTPTSAKSVLPPVNGQQEVWVVSASLDGSLRRWSVENIASLPRPEMVRPTVDAQHSGQVQEWDQHSLPPVAASNGNKGQDTVVGPKGGVQMTAEEEAELAELMDSDDE